MNSVKFNRATREIEIKGTKSFIESHSDIIGKYPVRIAGAGNVKGSAGTRSHWKVVLEIDPVEQRRIKVNGTRKEFGLSPAVQETPGMKSPVPEESKTKRPPVRKYFNASGKLIRSEETKAAESTEPTVVTDTVEKLPKGMSFSALKEKFGLSEDKIKEIIEEAEKQGKIRRDMDGSLVWV
jgi:hypothetical protein